MDCVAYTIDPEVPSELSSAATCAAAFYKVSSALEQLQGEEAIRKHTLFTTSRGHLVEVVSGTVQRSTPAPKDVTKIVVHHDFEPQQRYVALLCGSGKAVLLAYADFKVLHEWGQVRDVASADPKATGSPQFHLTMADGDSQVMSNTKLMSYVQRDGSQDEEEEEEEEDDGTGGKRDAVEALVRRFKSGLRHANQLRNERVIKENFIATELSSLRSWLKGRSEEREETLVAVVAIGEVPGGAAIPSLGPLRVLRIFHNIIHNKWVIMINVYNEAEMLSITTLELTLWSDEGPLQHTSKVIKSVRHSSARGGEVRVTIDHLRPLLLRPKKRATVVGVCDIPSFTSGPSVTCSGLLSYTVQANKASCDPNTSNGQEYQLSIKPVTLNASQLQQHMSSWEHCIAPQPAGVSFSTVALVTASHQSHISVTSLVSPLDGFLNMISQQFSLIKVSGVSDLYVLPPKESHPLQHSGFIVHPEDAHTLTLDLFTRDERQALILTHSLMAALPKDTSFQFLPSSNDLEDPSSQSIDLQHAFMSKAREVADFIVDTLEAQVDKNVAKKQKKNEDKEEEKEKEGNRGRRYEREREEFLLRKGDIVFGGEEYRVWRKRLQGMMSEVDAFYLKYLKANCD